MAVRQGPRAEDGEEPDPPGRGRSDPEAEVARLVELGATRVRDTDEFGYRWTVMADPEGNEFCVAKGL